MHHKYFTKASPDAFKVENDGKYNRLIPFLRCCKIYCEHKFIYMEVLTLKSPGLKKKRGVYEIHALNFIKLGYILILVSSMYILKLVLSFEGNSETVIMYSKIYDMCASVYSAVLIMTLGAFTYLALP